MIKNHWAQKITKKCGWILLEMEISHESRPNNRLVPQLHEQYRKTPMRKTQKNDGGSRDRMSLH